MLTDLKAIMSNTFTTPPKTVACKQHAADLESSSDEDGYISPFNGSDNGDVPFTGPDGSLVDEMPPFSAYSLSPSARSLSPIEQESFESASSTPRSGKDYIGCSTPVYSTPPIAKEKDVADGHPAEGYVTLDEIHARIGLTPPDVNVSRCRLNLETIYEGVFLDTPPKKEFQSKGNLLRRSIRNRALLGDKAEQKENMP
ncbi:uncharacterized protein LOC128731367 [Anopheles nili]|uniref:uncharacterized protein LOC128731367 n=1 Tax=Anopheles nili TaxID=185578 RepID=UPI00237A26A0|nr:uncharacterized protein LOC128731367 [Anopheles nili]